MNEEWSLSNLPPAGHKECAKFAYSLYEAALAELRARAIATGAPPRLVERVDAEWLAEVLAELAA